MNKFLMDYACFGSKKLKVYDYTSIDMDEVKTYINSLDKSWFEYIKIYDGTKIEKVCYDYYDNTDYFDLILYLNGRDMLFDMPYTADTIIDDIENELKEYEFRIYNNDKDSIVNKARNKLKESIKKEKTDNDLYLNYIKVIKKNYINEVKRNIINILSKQKEMFNLIEYLNI